MPTLHVLGRILAICIVFLAAPHDCMAVNGHNSGYYAAGYSAFGENVLIGGNTLKLSQRYIQVPPSRQTRPLDDPPSPGNNTDASPSPQYPPSSVNPDDYENSGRFLEDKTRRFYEAMISGDAASVLPFYDRNMTRYFKRSYPSWSFVEEDALKYFSRWSQRSGTLVEISNMGYDPGSGGYHVRLVYRYYYTEKSGRYLTGVSTNDLIWTSGSTGSRISSITEYVDRHDR